MSSGHTDDETFRGLLQGRLPSPRIELGRGMWGFGGVHGGVALAVLTAAMRQHAPDRALRAVMGQFARPIRGAFEVEVEGGRVGRTLSSWSARAEASGEVLVSARALFAAPGQAFAAEVAPPAPDAPVPADCPPFAIPSELVPFARRTEIRPVGTSRPFAGGPTPELIAWLRLVDDDAPPDEVRLVVLMDALAPSYAAVLTEVLPIPTVTLEVRPGAALGRARSPWILLRARTLGATADGWVDERLDAWDPDGRHLGSGHQLRVVTGVAS